MAFTLYTPGWFGWQILPGYGGERCVPSFAPIHLRRFQQLKTGRGLLEIELFDALYPGGARDFSVRLKVLDRAANFMVGRIVNAGGDESQVAVISHLEFGWLEKFCGRLLAAFPPESLVSPLSTTVSMYLDGVLLQDPPLPSQPDDLNSGIENEWLTYCALRLDGHAFAEDNELNKPPGDFYRGLLLGYAQPGSVGHRMTAMFMLQRGLMKEGVQSKTSLGWKLLRELFLELAPERVPDRYRLNSWHRDWEERFVPILGAGRALIRELHASCRYEAGQSASPQQSELL